MTKARGINITTLIMAIISIGLSFFVRYITSNTNMILIISQSVVLIPPLIYVFLTKQNIFKLIRFKKIGFATVVLIFIFTYCMIPLFNLINAISMLFAKNFIGETVTNVAGNNIIIGLIMIAVMPSIVEEVTYRGVLYNAYKGNKPLKAIILSGLIFGAMHMNVNQFMYAAVLGMLMALMLEATDSIISTMIMHFIFNGNSVVIMYLLPKLQRFLESTGDKDIDALASTEITKQEMLQSIKVLFPVAIVTTIGAIGIFIVITHINGRTEYIKSIFRRNKGEENNTRIFDIFIILVLMLCLAFSIFIEFIR